MAIDFAKKLSVADVEEIQRIFRSMPTFNESIAKADVVEFFKKIGWERNEEQLAAYNAYMEKFLGGRCLLHLFLEGLSDAQDTAGTMLVAARAYDTNGDGFISEDEFEELKKTLAAHDPRLKEVNFTQFVEEADTDRDGRISVQEFADWIRTSLKITM